MSLEELISLERIEDYQKTRLKETYLVYKLSLSKLFVEVIELLNKNIFPLLNMHILLYSLNSVPFTDEAVGVEALETLKDYLEEELYGKATHYSSKKIYENFEKLSELIVYEYFIEGSLIVYRNFEIEWDLNVSISPPS